MSGWAVLLNDVLIDDGCDPVAEDPTCPIELPAPSGWLTAPPDGLGVPELRVEDVTFPQRDGAVFFKDWYQPRIITMTVSVCPDEECGGGCPSARQKVRQITQAWSRACDNAEMVVFTDCHGSDEDRSLVGPYGIIGRPRQCQVVWNGQTKCADILLRFDAVDQRMYILDECGTPGSGTECLILEPNLFGGATICASPSGFCFADGEICFSEGNVDTLPVSAVQLTQGQDTTGDVTVITTASVSPSPDKLILAAVTLNSGGTVISVAGNGLTWELVGTFIRGAARVEIWGAVGPAPTAGTITFTTTTPQQSRQWGVVEVTNALVSGGVASAIGNNATSSVAIGTTATATLSSITPGSAIFGFPYVGTSSAITPGAGFTELVDISTTVPGNGFGIIYNTSGDLSVDATWSSANSVIYGMEVKAAPVPDTIGTATVLGTECSCATITLYGQLTDPVIRNLTTGEFVSYNAIIQQGGDPVIINGETMTATQGGQSRTHLLSGSTQFCLSPGDNELSLDGFSANDTGYAEVCWRTQVVVG